MKEIAFQNLQINPFTAFGSDYMALAAGNKQCGFNAMTVSWGHIGALWERGSHAKRLPTAICYVRPSCYTKEFIDAQEMFTLSHFDVRYRKSLGILGSRSGRDCDKIADAGLTPTFSDGTVYFVEADLVFVCRKLYAAPLMESSFMDDTLVEFNYPKRDFHTMYVGEIVRILKND